MKSDKLIEKMKRFIGGQIIPLDEFHSRDWILYNLMSEEFRNYFLENPEGNSGKYKWFTRRVDGLINLRIYELED